MPTLTHFFYQPDFDAALAENISANMNSVIRDTEKYIEEHQVALDQYMSLKHYLYTTIKRSISKEISRRGILTFFYLIKHPSLEIEKPAILKVE